ncbi:uncharacterized protein LOC141622654 [Silene latifolia]|uniref:uncharacterized protein LOC141622654 n=1 Tax=Silene latifolia TaxID=37657 RepID=UPI003D78572D
MKQRMDNLPAFYFRPVEESLPKTNRFDDEEDESRVLGIADLSAQIEAMKNKVDMDEIFFGGAEPLKRESNKFASAAISYLQDKGHKLELVNSGSYEGKICGYGMRFHLNFKAKRADDPRAPVEMYFAQLYSGATLDVECCVSLGESDSLPYERDNQGCIYCTEFIHHPRGDCEGRIIGGQVVWGSRVN